MEAPVPRLSKQEKCSSVIDFKTGSRVKWKTYSIIAYMEVINPQLQTRNVTQSGHLPIEDIQPTQVAFLYVAFLSSYELVFQEWIFNNILFNKGRKEERTLMVNSPQTSVLNVTPPSVVAPPLITFGHALALSLSKPNWTDAMHLTSQLQIVSRRDIGLCTLICVFLFLFVNSLNGAFLLTSLSNLKNENSLGGQLFYRIFPQASPCPLTLKPTEASTI